MLISDNDNQSLVNIDPLMGSLYYLIFMVSSLNKITYQLTYFIKMIIYLMIFKMFIAILAGHFTELTAETGVFTQIFMNNFNNRGKHKVL